MGGKGEGGSGKRQAGKRKTKVIAALPRVILSAAKDRSPSRQFNSRREKAILQSLRSFRMTLAAMPRASL
jgi:hypothetical protein